MPTSGYVTNFHGLSESGVGVKEKFFSRQWVAEKVHRSIRFVSQRWEKSCDKCFVDYSACGRKLKLSEESQNIIINASSKQRRSSSTVAKEIAERQEDEYVNRSTRSIIIVTEQD